MIQRAINEREIKGHRHLSRINGFFFEIFEQIKKTVVIEKKKFIG